jgi:hypothetical protein
MVTLTRGTWPNMKFGVICMIDIRATLLSNVIPRPSIQGDSRGEINIWGGDTKDHSEKKKNSYICV